MFVSGEKNLNEEDPLLVGSKIIKKRKLEWVRYPCDKCEYSATSQNNLREHIENKHEGVKYPCDICEFAASSVIYLKRHVEIKHEEVRYLCDKCEFAAFTLNYQNI